MAAPSSLPRRPVPGERREPGSAARRWLPLVLKPALLRGLALVLGAVLLAAVASSLVPAAWAVPAPAVASPARIAPAKADSAVADSAMADSAMAVSTATDTTALAAPATAAPESLWAIPLGRMDTLEGARERQAALQTQGVKGFARVRADSSGYWYELFAGPVAGRVAADSLAAKLKAVLQRHVAAPVPGRWGELVLGAVTPLPPTPAGARPAATPPGPPATGEASAAKPAEAQNPVPRVLELVKPVYSDAARARALSGTVKIRVLVGEDGQPRDFNIVQPVNPLLDGPALEAAAASRYAPAEVDGRPVPAWIELSFTFP